MKKYAYIDALRGLAILLVVLVHTGQKIPGLPQIVKFVCNIGQFGVQLFFVVSAVTLAMSWAERKNDTKATKAFFIRRFFRIAPMYYAGILLYTLISVYESLKMSGNLDPSLLGRVFANVFFIHGFVPAANNNVVPGGWSIGCEVAFYALFPALATRLTTLRAVILAIVFWLLILSSSLYLVKGLDYVIENNSFAYFNLATQMPVFLLGLVAYHLLTSTTQPKNLIGHKILFVASTGLLCTAFRGGLPLGFLFCPSIAGMAFSSLTILMSRRTVFPSLLLEIGKRSFSIYILHFVFAFDILPRLWRYAPSAALGISATFYLCIMYTIIVGICFIIAGWTYRYIEKPFVSYGHKLCSQIQSNRDSIEPHARS